MINLKPVVLVMATLLMGCHATLERAPNSEHSGIIKYYNDGPEQSLNDKRESAFKQMREACGGPYLIVSESIRNEEGDLVPIGLLNLQTHNEFVYLEFSCANRGSTQ